MNVIYIFAGMIAAGAGGLGALLTWLLMTIRKGGGDP